MRELGYNGHPMTWAPVRPSTFRLMDQLKERGTSSYIILEPGDATRYELIVSRPPTGGLIVQRVSGGEPSGTAFMLYEYTRVEEIEHRLKDNGCHNAWSRTLLAWWLDGLRDQLFN